MKYEELKENDIVIFKRYNDILGKYDYQDGFVTNIYPSHEEVDICWLEGHMSRNDSVKYSNVIAKYDENGEYMSFGNYSGNSILIS